MATEKMKFEATTGEKFEVPYLADAVSIKQARAIRKKHKDNYDELSDAFMEAGLPKDDYDRVMEMSLRDYERFSVEWLEAEDVSVGE